jgi:hypothetical protein
MQGLLTTHFGSWLSIVGTSITTSFQRGTAVQTEGLSELEAVLIAVFDPATTITTMDFQLQTSDDLTNWDPIATINLSTATVAAIQSLTASAGNTVRNRIQINRQANEPQFRLGRYCAIAVKSTGASKSGDSAASNLNFND